MNSTIFIREFNDTDYPAIVQLWESLGLGGAQRGDDLPVIRQTLLAGGHLLVMTEKDAGAIIGTSWLTIDGRRTYIHHFGIHKAFQGKGLANLLLDASLKLAKTIGMQIKLEVHRDNVKALSLYKKAGFQSLGDYQVLIIRDISAL